MLKLSGLRLDTLIPSNRIQRFALSLLALASLGACRTGEPPNFAHARDFALVIPIYNDAGLTHARTTLRPHLGSNDSFMVVSGNAEGEVDTLWLNRAAARLEQTYPEARIFAATSGLPNLAAAASGLGPIFEALVYVYEPNFPNQPEFSWDFGTTLRRFREAETQAREAGFRTIGKPTGRPILQNNLQRYAWDYGELAATVDELFIQTQTYCRESVAAFSEALDTLSQQYRTQHGTGYGTQDSATRSALPWVPQVTVDPDAPNGTPVARARACIRAAQDRGLLGAMLWWSPNYAAHAVDFLRLMNADAARSTPRETPQRVEEELENARAVE